MFSNILVPLDGSEFGDKALPIAQDLAQLSGATIHLLQVISRQPEAEAVRGRGGESIQSLEIGIDSARRLIEARTTRGNGHLETIATLLQNDGIKAETAMREGAADENIVKYAKEAGIDLIVMSTHGHGALRRFFIGSVTDRVIRSCETPVLIVPAS